jgi:anthranilate synthase component 1
MRPSLTRDQFVRLAAEAPPPGRLAVVPLCVRLLSDQLTPVLAYRRLVAADRRDQTSFLLESVEGGDRQGRHSILGAHPRLELIARRDALRVIDHTTGAESAERTDDPLAALRERAGRWALRMPDGPAAAALPACVLGGWFGFASYDSVRYAEPEKLPWDAAPADDRGLPDLHFSLFDQLVVFDHVDKLVHAVQCVPVDAGDDAGRAYDEAVGRLAMLVERLQTHSRPLPVGAYLDPSPGPGGGAASNLTRDEHARMVARAKEYIAAGDIFQVVVGQRFERRSPADPFDVYRTLRAVNPSPYMVYMQAEGVILVASSPEILCRVREEEGGRRVVTNRPLAGTRRRGATPAEDAALERELLADDKERAEHVMLLDLGRNDVGKVAVPGTIETPAVMEIERYSHVMHISSTVTGELRPELDAWDALRATLPVGTISGAPKIRAMQIIDELEPLRRGPYGGGFGYVGLAGEMDIALALRTIVVPTASHAGDAWTYHVQAAGGIVHDSEPGAEHDETVNKAAALVRAIDLAERAFPRGAALTSPGASPGPGASPSAPGSG